MTNKYFVRDPDEGNDWADIEKPVEGWEVQEAAERFAEHQCHRDSDCYGKYMEGHDLEVRLVGIEHTSTVTVWVREEPQFSSRIKVKQLPDNRGR